MSGAKNALNDFVGGNTMDKRAFSENEIKYNTRTACVLVSSGQTRLQTENLYESGNRDDDNGGIYDECQMCARQCNYDCNNNNNHNCHRNKGVTAVVLKDVAVDRCAATTSTYIRFSKSIFA